MKKRSALRAVAQMVWRATGGKIAWTGLLTLVAALTEGISITLLIPIVAAASSETAGQAAEIPIIGPWLAKSSLGLPALLALFVLLVSFQAMLNFAKNFFALTIMQHLSDRLKQSLMRALAAARWDTIAQKRLSDVNQILTSGIPRCISAATALVALVQATILIVIYLGLAAIVSWQMAVFAVIVGSILFALMFPLRRKATYYGNELTKLFEQHSHVTLDFLNGVRFAKSFVAEGRFLTSFERYLETIRTRTFRYYFQSSLGTALFQIGTAVIASSFVYIAITSANLSLGELAVLLIIFARLTPRFGTIQEQSQQFLASAPAYFQFKSLVRYFAAARESAGVSQRGAMSLSREITLKDITMRYSPDAAPSLCGVSARIPSGRITALLGSSGSGKSTLADIVSGLFPPTEGLLAVDGVPVSNSNLRAWRSRVAIVPQDAFLFDTSIRENLLLAKSSATEDELWSALERAEIAELVRSLPEGLDTSVGNRGTRFSGGERQRLAIARALLPDPELLILDEATSALDMENQGKIARLVEGLRDQGLTILLIAHQASLADVADERITLDMGSLAAVTPGAAA